MDFANYTEKALANKLRRQKQVRRNRNILIVLTVLIIVWLCYLSLFQQKQTIKNIQLFTNTIRALKLQAVILYGQ